MDRLEVFMICLAVALIAFNIGTAVGLWAAGAEF